MYTIALVRYVPVEYYSINSFYFVMEFSCTLAGFIVPSSFIIGNSKKRKMFLSKIGMKVAPGMENAYTIKTPKRRAILGSLVLIEILILLIHYSFIRILVKCYKEDRQQSYYAAVPCLEVLSLLGAFAMIFCFTYFMVCTPTTLFYDIYYLILSIPNMLVFIDGLLCLQRFFIFFDMAPNFCGKFKYYVVLTLFLSIPVSYIITLCAMGRLIYPIDQAENFEELGNNYYRFCNVST
ncbi:unnamed protein product [Caenorhabditis auriculariae]|uniref:Uncharacterized protein n=1 Tax=Caenorhabditis auriculariae TaxID=2777116 RepID=A0A8S1HZT6_9PELO|nr:unnamed protein product [Caenorhabditis auriculariae]